MTFTKGQKDLLADYLADLSKILFASVIVGFFLPSSAGHISIPVWIIGIIIGIVTIGISIKLARQSE